MIPLAAYADRLSARPGDTVRFHVSNATGESVTARLVRVVSADPNPAGPGIVTEPLDAMPRRLCEPQAHPVPSGSFARTAAVPARIQASSFAVACRVCPTRVNGADQALLACLDGASGRGFALGIDAEGHLFARLGRGRRVRLARRLRSAHWACVWMSVDRERGILSLGRMQVPGGLSSPGGELTAEEPIDGEALDADAPLLVGAWDANAPGAHLNGRIERPALYARAFDAADLSALRAGALPEGPYACWDFSRDMASSRVADTGPHALHAVTVNCPARAMRGAAWDGSEMCWRHRPEHYGAVHFHDDDLDDCRWPAAFEWTVPAGARSSCYALELEAGEARENVPFFVVPRRGERSARLAVLVSTFTYTVYGNHLRAEWSDPEWRGAWLRQVQAWEAYPHNAGEHPEYGLSTYNDHSDRSGISIASWHRPMFNVRVGYLTYPYPEIRGSGLRHLPADTHLTAWLERTGIDYDLVTDWELEREGEALLEGYSVLMTGSHPEYHTRRTLDALEAYRDRGGRLCYMGGNGFYWKVALSPERAGVIEIRRAEGGIRAWAADPGEYYHQFDGEYGGLWRRNGRPPQRLAGVGFTAQGNFLGSYYRKRPAASDPRAAWIFDGVGGETFGDHGLSGHGAAGFELDRADVRLGTPEHALVIASSENHPADAPWVLVPEEALTHLTTWPGEPAERLIRADMTFFETPAGGAVFSTGSITFCGSLLSNGGDNDVSRIVANVLERFLDPRPFAMPEGA